MTTCYIDFRMVSPQKLSLNVRTRYYVAYNCHPYDILGIFTKLESAIECLRWTLDQYLEYAAADPENRDVASYDRILMRNLSMWECMEVISEETRLGKNL